MTLGDALTQAKDTTLASVEELHTLVGGADIKVGLELISRTFLSCRDGNTDVSSKKGILKKFFFFKKILVKEKCICFVAFFIYRVVSLDK